jgi:hypothetical protein
LRNFTLFILTIFLSLPAWSQRKCGTETAVLQKIQENPSLQALRDRDESRIQSKTRAIRQLNGAAKTAGYTSVTIPVVVHIVMQDPTLVTDAQVQSQIDVLNQDYAALNPDVNILPSVWRSLVGDAQLQFCLAQQDPEGALTNGIHRVRTNTRSFSIDNAAKAVKFSSSGGTNQWDNNRYLNIWVTVLSGGYLGVATFPNLYNDNEQGVVIDYRGFGTTGSAAAPYDLGRTGTHEVGHYFNLRHIWGDEDLCAADDGVDDTPKQAEATYGTASWPKTDICTGTSPGIMFYNYMDYTDDEQLVLFTTQQVDRIRTTLSDDRYALMSSDACIPLNLKALDAQVFSVLSPFGQVCDQGITPVVVLKNMGSTPLTAVDINYKTDAGTTYTLKWTGRLTALKSDTITLGSSDVTVGEHILRAFTSAPNGGADEDATNDTAYTTLSYYNDAVLPISEGFESSTFPPAGWEIVNPDGRYTWEQTSAAGSQGSGHSIVMHNLAYEKNGAIDDIRTPVINPAGTDSIFLFFDVAAATYSNHTGKVTNDTWDSLYVLTTADCGLSFDTLYAKGGATLATKADSITTEYVPAAGEWRRDSVNLTPILQKGAFRIVFRNLCNAENNVYLDNVNIVAKSALPALKEKGVIITPNPTSGLIYITFLGTPENLDHIGIYNSSGVLVATRQGSYIDSNNRFTFDLVNEPNGVYFVKLFYRNNKGKAYKILKVN